MSFNAPAQSNRGFWRGRTAVWPLRRVRIQCDAAQQRMTNKMETCRHDTESAVNL